MKFYGNYYTKNTTVNCTAFLLGRAALPPQVTLCNKHTRKEVGGGIFLIHVHSHYHHSEGMLGISKMKKYRVSDAKSLSWWHI